MATAKKSNSGRNAAPAQDKDRPVHVVRFRNIRGNIWANRLPSGDLAYNVTFDRSWKEDDQVNENGQVIKEGEWHQSQSFGRDDLLLLAKVADLCHTWIHRQSREESF
jgi:hypothetical protein